MKVNYNKIYLKIYNEINYNFKGSAMDALSGMQTFLQGRPKLFNSIEQAIEYRLDYRLLLSSYISSNEEQ